MRKKVPAEEQRVPATVGPRTNWSRVWPRDRESNTIVKIFHQDKGNECLLRFLTKPIIIARNTVIGAASSLAVATGSPHFGSHVYKKSSCVAIREALMTFSSMTFRLFRVCGHLSRKKGKKCAARKTVSRAPNFCWLPDSWRFLWRIWCSVLTCAVRIDPSRT